MKLENGIISVEIASHGEELKSAVNIADNKNFFRFIITHKGSKINEYTDRLGRRKYCARKKS